MTDDSRSRLGQALKATKQFAKRSLLTAGPQRLVQGAIELLRAAEPRYSKSSLEALLKDVIARSDTARQAQLCSSVLELWREEPAFAPYALRVFRGLESHLAKVDIEIAQGLEVCELGPGDSLCLAALIASRGVTYVGVDPWGPVLEPPLYQLAAAYFREEAGVDISALIDTSSDPVQPAVSIQRRRESEGLATSSVDLVFSIAVLEHVRKPLRSLSESLRILRPGGYALHQIDYEDHRGRGAAGWDFLRFPASAWERMHTGEQARNYTNRLRHSQWCRLIDEVGFEVVETSFDRVSPPDSPEVHCDIGPLAEDDLEIQSAHFILRKPIA